MRLMRRGARPFGRAIIAVAVLTATVVFAQQPGKHPVSGRVYAQTMGVQGASWLDRPERDREEDPDLAIRLLRIQKGATVADVGAGSGNITIRLAKQVGPMGKVYANDIQPGMLEILQKNVAKAKLTNVMPVLGAIDDPKLPAESIDLAIMVDVYHEFSEPQKMLQRLREAIKPGGRLVLLEYRAEDPDLAIRLLRIQKGATVADVGAGSGNITIRLAKQVGPMGKVYANDIQPGMLDILQKNVARAKLTNVTPVLGAIDDPKLPAESIDLAIMVDVYHEFSEPQKMLQRLREAIKPGGRLVLLEYRAEDLEVPILREHKMTKAQVKLEVEHEGFQQQRVFDDLPRQHLIVFTRP